MSMHKYNETQCLLPGVNSHVMGDREEVRQQLPGDQVEQSGKLPKVTMMDEGTATGSEPLGSACKMQSTWEDPGVPLLSRPINIYGDVLAQLYSSYVPNTVVYSLEPWIQVLMPRVIERDVKALLELLALIVCVCAYYKLVTEAR